MCFGIEDPARIREAYCKRVIFRKTASLSAGERQASSSLRSCGVSAVSLSRRSLRCFAPYLKISEVQNEA